MDRRPRDAVRTALLHLYEAAGGAASVRAPRGYAHLGLAVIDAVYSLRAQYDRHVVPVIEAYCVGTTGLEEKGARFASNGPEHGVDALLAVTRDLTENELVAKFGGNRQCAPGTRIRKAVVVRNLADALAVRGVLVRADLQARWSEPGVEYAVLRVCGIGPAAWRYVLSLSGVERVKPDTMVTAWVRQAVGDSSITPVDAANLLESAAIDLGRDALTVRAADHLVWRAASGRPLSP